jgi:uncharacterized membrane protein YphA (DoxX/SURF4 family)
MMQSSPLNFRRVFIWIGRLLLGAIFVYAGYAKLTYPNHRLWPWFILKFSVSANLSTFAFQVESYKVLGAAGSSLVAHTLPFVEIVLGLLLLIGWKFRIWAAMVTAILLGFLTLVTRAYLLHMDINCGCFGVPEPLTIVTVIRDGALVAVALVTTIFSFQEAGKPHPWTASTPST